MKKITPLIIFFIIGIFLFLSLNSNPNKLPSPLVGKIVPEVNGKDFFTNENVKFYITFVYTIVVYERVRRYFKNQ